MATENTKKTGREKLLERLRGRNPELNIEDDEAVSGQISSDYDQMDQREQEREKFKEMLSSNPYAAPIITGLATGKNDDGSDFDLAEWFIDNEPDMLIDMIEGNPKTKERYTKMRDERKKKAEEDAAFDAEADQRLQAMDAELDAAAAEAGYKPEDTRELMEWLFGKGGLLDRAKSFDLKKDDFLQIIRIKDRDKDIEKATNDGYVRGKNEKIDVTQHKRGQRNKLPVIGGGGGQPSAQEKDPMLENLNRMKDIY